MPRRDPEVTIVRFLRNEEFGEPHLYAEEIDRDLEAGTVTYKVTFPLFGRERSQGESSGQVTGGEALETVIVTPEPDLTVVDDELAAAIDEEMPDLPGVD